MTPSATLPAPPPDLPSTPPAAVGMDPHRLELIRDAFQAAMNDGQVCGGVVLVARRGRIVYEQAFGHRATVPQQEEATTDTLYDLASLTKPIATASAIMRLVEQGRLRLNDPVERYLPEWKPSDEETSAIARAAQLRRLLAQEPLRVAIGQFPFRNTTATRLLESMSRAGQVRLSDTALDSILTLGPHDRREVRLRHLLTHTAGLDPFDRYYLRWPEGNARDRILGDIATRPLRAAAGQKFIYSDLGFITLGEIVERVTGKSLADFCREEIFAPLGMHDTLFCPPEELHPRIAPTEYRSTSDRTVLRGRVHDGNAAVQNGISGHAGLFSTARNLARFCQMLLNGGHYGGVRIFSPATIRAMTTDQAGLDGKEQRGYGWDISTGYSGQRGDIFATGYGHTGWTGTSIWVVPEEELFIIILTNRVHPDGTGDAGPIRSRIANVVAGSLVE